MSSTPAFGNKPNIGSSAVSATADNTYTAPAHQVTLVTAGANGTIIDEIDAIGLGTTVAGNVCIALYDGTNYHIFDEFTVTVVNASTTAAAYRAVKTYTNCFIPSGWTLVAWSMVASQLVNVLAFGEDL